MIPQTIHIIWLGDHLPLRVASVANEWAAIHPEPEWSVRIVRTFPAETPAEVLAMVRQCRRIGQVADLLKLCILHTAGGFVIDADLVPVRSLAELVPGYALAAAHDGRDRRINNAFLAAEPGSDFTECVGRAFSAERPDYEATGCFGPELLTQLFPIEQATDTTQNSGPLAVLPWHYVHPFHLHEALRAQQWFGDDAFARDRTLSAISPRFADGQWPFAVHLWRGQGNRPAGDVERWIHPSQRLKPEEEGFQLPVVSTQLAAEGETPAAAETVTVPDETPAAEDETAPAESESPPAVDETPAAESETLPAESASPPVADETPAAAEPEPVVKPAKTERNRRRR